MSTHRKLARLTRRDRDILAHVLRYRMSTRPILKRLFFHGLKDDALKSTLRRLAAPRHQLTGSSRKNFLRHFYLQSFPICTPDARVYYRLTRRGAEEVAELEGLAKIDKVVTPLQAQQLIANYAVLAFCCREGGAQVLSKHEMVEHFPQLSCPGFRKHPYCLERANGKPHLNYLLVDHGAQVRWSVKKVMRAIERRLPIPAFERLMRRDRFSITLLTAYESKREDIEKALSLEEPPVAVRVHVVPNLAYVVEAQDEADD